MYAYGGKKPDVIKIRKEDGLRKLKYLNKNKNPST